MKKIYVFNLFNVSLIRESINFHLFQIFIIRIFFEILLLNNITY